MKQRKRSKDLKVHCHRRKCTRRQQNYTGESVKSVWRETERERERGKEGEEDCEEKWGAEAGLYSKQEGKVRHGQCHGQLGGW